MEMMENPLPLHHRLPKHCLVVLTGTTLTHPANSVTNSPWTPDNGIFIACTTLTVQAGGQINGDGLGFGAGYWGSSGYGPGRGIYGNNRGGGAGYGGAGGTGTIYRNLGKPRGTTFSFW
jgi:hypothetical protein